MAEQLDIWGSDKSERGSLADRLRALLEADTQAGMVPLSRGGKISRKHYAGMLACARPALTRHIDILAEFERRLGAATGPMRLLSSMREWLARSYESRELGVRDGKIDRAAFAAQFGLRGGTFLTRYPEIRALIEDYDARAKRENYLPANRQEELDRVRVALEHGPELSKDRKNISLTALSAASGVPVSRLRENIFAKVIADAQSRVAENVKASKIDPYFHGRVFPFSNLLPTWGSRFTERAATRFKQVISGLAEPSSKHIYLSLLNVLIWIGESDNPNCLAVVAEAQKDGRVSAAGEWEDALFAHRDHLLMGVANGTLTENSVDSAITRLRTALDALASGGVVPGTATPIPGVKHARRQALHRPSVAEVTFSARDTADYVAFARAHFEDSCKRLGLDMGSGDSEPFFGSIGQALNTGAALPDDPAEAVRMVLERRLEKLRARAWAFVEEAASMHDRGQELISKATIDSAQFEAAYLGNYLNKYQRTMLVHNLFPGREASDDQVERGVANFLALIDQLRGGIPPLLSSPDPDYGQFFAKRYLHYGGLQTIQPMLIPDNDAVGSVLTLYLLDSGANVAVGRTLDRECIEVS